MAIKYDLGNGMVLILLQAITSTIDYKVVIGEKFRVKQQK